MQSTRAAKAPKEAFVNKTARAFGARLRDRFFRTKWLVMLTVIIALVFFGRVTDIKSLTQSALVIGLGIEKTGDSFAVSTLSVVVSGSAGGDNAQNYIVYSAEGATISEGLDAIAQKMGLLVSLSHCNVLVLSPSVFSVDHAQLFDPLISSYSLPEQAAVTATEGAPSDVLAARMGTTVASAYLVQAALLQNLGGDGLTLVTVKDFLADSLSRSGSVNIPLVDVKDSEHQPEGQQEGSGGTAELVMNRNLVVNGGDCFVLEEDLAQAATMLVRKKVFGRLSPVLPGGEAVEFRVLDVAPKLAAEGMTVRAELEVSVSFLEAQNSTESGKITPSSAVVKAAAEQAAKDLEERIYACHALSLAHGADFLHLQNEVYKKAGYTLPEDCLDGINFSCSVKVTVKEAG